MLFDVLTVLVVTLFSSLFLCTTSVHGLPPSAIQQYIQSHPTASLRHLHHHPVPSVHYDLGGDTSEMLVGDSNEYPAVNNHADESSAAASSSAFFTSSLDAPDEALDYYTDAVPPSKSLFRKLLISFGKENEASQEQQQQSQKRSASVPAPLHLNSALAAAAFADPSNANSVVNLSNLSESTRLSPSLKALVETNPFARAWLTILLQKVMEEQPVPYVFKYGRRRKK